MSQKLTDPKIQALIERIESHGSLDPNLAKQFLEESGISAENLTPWADFDHPKADSYGRKLIYDGGFFELMAMSWTDGDMSGIHDHGSTQWGAVQVFGDVEHAVFKRKGARMKTVDRSMYPKNSVAKVDHDLIHAMGNVGQPDYFTLHLYGAYGMDGDITADAHVYDLDEGLIEFTDGGVFFDLPKDKIKRTESGPVGDFSTQMRFHVEWLSRTLTANQNKLTNRRMKELAENLFSAEYWQALVSQCEAEKNSPTSPRLRGTGAEFFQILDFELKAAARMQIRLLDLGLAPAVSGEFVAALEKLNKEDRVGFSPKYMQFLSDQFGLIFG